MNPLPAVLLSVLVKTTRADSWGSLPVCQAPPGAGERVMMVAGGALPAHHPRDGTLPELS